MSIPTVDLSPFLNEEHVEDDQGTKRVKEIINHACSKYGFFQIVNHGVPLSLMSEALELSKRFFELAEEEKVKFSPKEGSPLPTGYSIQPSHSPDKNEYLLMFPPRSDFNILPNDPPELRKVMEEIFCELSKLALVLEKILNDCLGLPPKFLEEYDDDRSWDIMVALRYFPATKVENVGNSEHQDGNCITFVFQDVGGLEVLKDGDWIPIDFIEGSLIVNLGDILQVLSNNKFKSATHRVVRPEGKSRHSYAFFHNLEGNKWVEPLPMFSTEIGEPAKYRGFVCKEYQQLRMRNKTHPPARPEDVISIKHYATPT